MDAISSGGRDDSSMPKPCLLIKRSNDEPEMESPVFRLPTELTMLIFRECRSDIRLRLTLTHICQRWRQIAVNDASLWTNICIQTMERNPNSRLDHFSSLLGMQLDRTANLLLDVEWFAEIGEDFFIATLELIRQKAPFSRWRTLKARISGGPPQSSPWSTAVDAFTNLKSLVWHGTDSSIIRVIDGTITSHLEVLEFRGGPIAWQVDMGAFTRSFTHISSLHLGDTPSIQVTSFLSANIVNLELDRAQEHPFPYVQTYTLRECTFIESSAINLGNLTTLIVCGALRISCPVFLPALQQLTLEIFFMYTNGRIEAPALNMLRVKPGPGFRISYGLLSEMNKHLQGPGYLLSPNSSIIANSYLPGTTVLNFLAKSPKVTQAILRFEYWEDAHPVLEKLIGPGVQPDSDAVENENLCPRLSELKLDFDWEFTEPSASKKWLIDRLKVRRRTCVMPPLSIYVGWKGEGTYVLLTGE